MKKTAALILALAMVLGLCACGQKVTEDVPATNPVSQVMPQDTIDERIEIEDLVLYEDEKCNDYPCGILYGKTHCDR